MEFGEYLQRVKEIENSSRSDSAKKSDVAELQGRWREEVKKKQAGQKKNDLHHINKEIDRRLEMKQKEFERKWVV